jgi:uridine kinase
VPHRTQSLNTCGCLKLIDFEKEQQGESCQSSDGNYSLAVTSEHQSVLFLIAMKREALIAELATVLEAIRSNHPLRVAIDGVDAVGKTTLADKLAIDVRKLGRAAIRASIDGFHNPASVRYRLGRTSPLGYFKDSFNYAALKTNLLVPLGPHGSRAYRSSAFDHRKDSEVLSPLRQAQPESILLFDGVFLQCEELRDCWDFIVWMEAEFETTVARALARDKGPSAAQYAARYVPGQQLYIAECRPRENAHIIINNEDFHNPAMSYSNVR